MCFPISPNSPALIHQALVFLSSPSTLIVPFVLSRSVEYFFLALEDLQASCHQSFLLQCALLFQHYNELMLPYQRLIFCLSSTFLLSEIYETSWRSTPYFSYSQVFFAQLLTFFFNGYRLHQVLHTDPYNLHFGKKQILHLLLLQHYEQSLPTSDSTA